MGPRQLQQTLSSLALVMLVLVACDLPQPGLTSAPAVLPTSTREPTLRDRPTPEELPTVPIGDSFRLGSDGVAIQGTGLIIEDEIILHAQIEYGEIDESGEWRETGSGCARYCCLITVTQRGEGSQLQLCPKDSSCGLGSPVANVGDFSVRALSYDDRADGCTYVVENRH